MGDSGTTDAQEPAVISSVFPQAGEERKGSLVSGTLLQPVLKLLLSWGFVRKKFQHVLVCLHNLFIIVVMF